MNQLIDIYNSFCKALDEGKEVRAVMSAKPSIESGTQVFFTNSSELE